MMSGIKDKKNEKNRGNMRTGIRKMTGAVVTQQDGLQLAAMRRQVSGPPGKMRPVMAYRRRRRSTSSQMPPADRSLS